MNYKKWALENLKSAESAAKIEIKKNKGNISIDCDGTSLSVLIALAVAEIDILEGMEISEEQFNIMKNAVKEDRK